MAVSGALVLVLAACTKQEALDATSVSIAIACAIEHAELDDAVLSQVCALTPDLIAAVRPSLLAARRKAKARVASCAPLRDAGSGD